MDWGRGVGTNGAARGLSSSRGVGVVAGAGSLRNLRVENMSRISSSSKARVLVELAGEEADESVPESFDEMGLRVSKRRLSSVTMGLG